MNYLEKSAIIDSTRRLVLVRKWNLEKSCIGFIGLNPSTANENTDDATIRRCVSFAIREGYGSMRMYNLFSPISTDPKKLFEILIRHPELNDENIEYLKQTVFNAIPVVCCWGSLSTNPNFTTRAYWVKKNIIHPLCFGTNKDGQPKHPLYLAKNTPLIPFV